MLGRAEQGLGQQRIEKRAERKPYIGSSSIGRALMQSRVIDGMNAEVFVGARSKKPSGETLLSTAGV